MALSSSWIVSLLAPHLALPEGEAFVLDAVADAIARAASPAEREAVIAGFLTTEQADEARGVLGPMFGDAPMGEAGGRKGGEGGAAGAAAAMGTTNRPVKTAKEKKKKPAKEKMTLDDVERTPVAGRRLCDCQAQTHDLVGNCLSCGRIVCAQEGIGPCLFCGAPWGAKYDPPAGAASAESDAAARAFKDRLVSYDREAAARTTVLDDQADWFSTSAFLGAEDTAWTTPEERQAAADRRRLIEDAEEELSQKKCELVLDVSGGYAFVQHDKSAEARLEQQLKHFAAPEAFATAVSSGAK